MPQHGSSPNGAPRPLRRHILTANDVVERWQSRGLRVTGTGRKGECPVHEDRTPSVSIREVGDAVKVHCFVCLDRDRVLAAVGLTWQDVTPFRDTGGWTNHTRTWQRPTVKPVPPRPKAELDRILDAFWTAGMTWRATPRLGVYRCECPLCRDPWLSVWVFSYDHEDDRAGCPAQVTCSNGCDPKEIARALVPDPDLLALRQSGWAA